MSKVRLAHLYVKESQIKDKLQNKSNGQFQIIGIHNNSATHLNSKTNQLKKTRFVTIPIIPFLRNSLVKYVLKEINPCRCQNTYQPSRVILYSVNYKFSEILFDTKRQNMEFSTKP